MSDALVAIKVVVLCTNSDGFPEFYPSTVQASPAQIAHGVHHGLAKDDARAQGYAEPMIGFDATDPASGQLGEMLAWI